MDEDHDDISVGSYFARKKADKGEFTQKSWNCGGRYSESGTSDKTTKAC